MSVKIFLAAVEHNDRHELFNSLGIRYRLMSFYYLRKKSKARLDELMYNTFPKDAVIMIDSGAFTFMDSKRKEILANPMWFWSEIEKYLEDYLAFLKKYRSQIYSAVELDLDSIIELDPVFEAPSKWKKDLDAWWAGEFPDDDERAHQAPPIVSWRKRLLEESKLPIVIVWHDERKQQGWVNNVELHKYCGIPSELAGGESRWFPFINTARKHNTVVHGFGMTKPQWIRKYPFYTVDSSSWVAGERYGTTVVFQNGRLRHYDKDHKDVRKRLKNILEKNGVDWKKIEAEDAWAVNQMNALAWTLYAEYVFKAPNKDYWENDFGGRVLGPPREIPESCASDAADAMSGVEELPPADDDGEWDALDPKPRPKKPLGSNGIDIKVNNKPKENEFRKLLPDISLDTMERPTLFCNNCFVQDRCEFMQADAVCHFKIDNKFTTPTELMEALRQILRRQYHRTLHAELVEKLDGGVLDKNVSGEFDRMMNMLSGFHSMMVNPNTESVEIKAKGGGAVSAILAQLLPKKRVKPDLVQISAPTNENIIDASVEAAELVKK